MDLFDSITNSMDKTRGSPKKIPKKTQPPPSPSPMEVDPPPPSPSAFKRPAVPDDRERSSGYRRDDIDDDDRSTRSYGSQSQGRSSYGNGGRQDRPPSRDYSSGPPSKRMDRDSSSDSRRDSRGGSDRYGSENRENRGSYGGGGYGGDRDRGGYGSDRSGHGGGGSYRDRSQSGDRGSYGGRGGGGGGYGGGRGGYENRGSFSSGGGGGYDVKPTVNFPVNSSGIKPAGEQEVLVNTFDINLDKAVDTIYKVQVDITASRLSRDGSAKTIDLLVQPKNPAGANHKIRNLNSLMKMAFRTYKLGEEMKYSWAYDNGSSLYITKKLFDQELIAINAVDLGNRMHAYFGGERTQSVSVTLTYVKEIRLRGAEKMLETENHRDVCAFLDVLLQAPLFRTAECFIVKNVIYHKSSKFESDLGRDSGKVIRDGFEKSVKVVEVGGIPRFVLSFMVKRKPFYKEQPLLDFVATMLNCRRDDVGRYLEKERRRISADLQHILVSTTYSPDRPQDFFITKLSKEDARYTIQVDEKTKTVEDYFLDKYQIRLDYPNLPLIAQKKGKTFNLYPMELLNVSRMQTLSVEKLGQLQRNVVDATRMMPDQQAGKMQEQLRAANLDGSEPNNYLDAFGVAVSGSANMGRAQIMQRPAIKTGNSTHDPARDRSINEMNWRDTWSEKFFQPAKCSRAAMVNYDGACRGENELRGVMSTLERCASTHGMKFPREIKYVDWYPMSDDDFLHAMKKLEKDGIEFIMVLSKNKDEEMHRQLKSAEQEVRVPTQHFSCETVGLGRKPQFGAQSQQNLIIKMNQKLGGINYILTITPSMTFGGFDAAQLSQRYFSPTRMYVGLDVSHVGPQSLYDQITKAEVRTPTTVGMCYTTTQNTAMRGLYWFQTAREQFISHLRTNMVKALENFKKQTGDYPVEMVVFRGGLSEGELDVVTDREVKGVDGIEAAFKGLGIQVKLHMIVVQKDSGVKVLKTNIRPGSKPMEANVPSGTSLVDNVVSTGRVECVLVPQKGMIGTSRATRITLTYESSNAEKMDAEILRFVSNAMCHAHGVSACPPGIPAPLYGATNLAKRGANVLRQNSSCGSDTMSMMSGASGTSATDDQSKDYYNRLSEELAVTLHKTQFWA